MTKLTSHVGRIVIRLGNLGFDPDLRIDGIRPGLKADTNPSGNTPRTWSLDSAVRRRAKRWQAPGFRIRLLGVDHASHSRVSSISIAGRCQTTDAFQ
jgi:hypothetical protein